MVDIVDSIYKPFHQSVEVTEQTAQRVTGERKLGIDPVSGRTITARIGRYGQWCRWEALMKRKNRVLPNF